MATRALRREIMLALVFKAVALALLYFAFFSGPHKTVVTPRNAAEYLFQSHAASQK